MVYKYNMTTYDAQTQYRHIKKLIGLKPRTGRFFDLPPSFTQDTLIDDKIIKLDNDQCKKVLTSLVTYLKQFNTKNTKNSHNEKYYSKMSAIFQKIDTLRSEIAQPYQEITCQPNNSLKLSYKIPTP